MRTDLLKRERVSNTHVHEVIFAVKLQNMDELTQILYDVSDPSSINYGKHKTSQEVKDLTSNPMAIAKIHEYLNISGAEIISESSDGEYIKARAPVKLWEEMFSTEFYAFHYIGESVATAIVRAQKYSIPLVLNDYVSLCLLIYVSIYRYIYE
jgi:subtilase family serine protease